MFRKNYKDHIKSVHPGKDINNFLLPQDTMRINKELLLPAVSSLSQEMEEAGKMMTKTRLTKLPRIVLLSPDMQRINKDLLLPAEMEEKLMRKTRQKKLVRSSVAMAPGLHLRKEVKMKKLLITKMLRSSFPIPIAH